MKCLLIKTTSYRRFLSNRLVGITAKKQDFRIQAFIRNQNTRAVLKHDGLHKKNRVIL